MTSYRPRDITPALLHALEAMPVVVLTGMRQTGKSTLLQRQEDLKRRRYLSLDDFAHLEAAQSAPEDLIAGDAPVTIDEVQRAPELLPAIKRAVDRDRRPGRFLLSGSANLALLAGASETLAGRAIYLTLQPFSRRELLGRIREPAWIHRCFETGRPPPGGGDPVASREILRGGLPPVCLDLTTDAGLWLRGYEQTYLERDIRNLSQVADLVSFRNLLNLAALRTGQVLNQSELARDAKLKAATAGRYLGLMETSCVLHRLPPHLTNRASRLIKSPKLYLTDSGLACHLTGVERPDALRDEPRQGALLETYVAQNLSAILASHWPQAHLAYWHVQGRHEVDFVIESGRDTMAIEVKAGSRWTPRDLEGLSAYLESAPRCRIALLAYNGTEAAPLGERLWAVPLTWVLG